MLWEDGDDPCVSRPQESAALLRSKYRELYDGFLKEAGENSEEAMKMFIADIEDYEGEYEVPEYFIGKKLVLPKDSIDHGDLVVRVQTDLRAWASQSYYETIELPRPGTSFQDKYLFDSQYMSVIWQQLYAESEGDEWQIEYVEIQDQEKGLYIARSEKPVGVVQPLLGMTSERYFKAEEVMKGRSLTDEEKSGIIRYHRFINCAFADDPLKNMVFLRRRSPRVFVPNDKEFKETVKKLVERPDFEREKIVLPEKKSDIVLDGWTFY